MSQIVSMPSESLDAAVGRRVHHLMWDRRITQTALGRALNIDQSGVGRRLRGETGWSLNHLAAAASALGTSMAYLLGEDENPQPGGAGGGSSLPGLDSNQEPAGSQPGNVVWVDFGSAA